MDNKLLAEEGGVGTMNLFGWSGGWSGGGGSTRGHSLGAKIDHKICQRMGPAHLLRLTLKNPVNAGELLGIHLYQYNWGAYCF